MLPDARRPSEHGTLGVRYYLLLRTGPLATRGAIGEAPAVALRALRWARRPGHVLEAVMCAVRPNLAMALIAARPAHMRAGIA